MTGRHVSGCGMSAGLKTLLALGADVTLSDIKHKRNALHVLAAHTASAPPSDVKDCLTALLATTISLTGASGMLTPPRASRALMPARASACTPLPSRLQRPPWPNWLPDQTWSHVRVPARALCVQRATSRARRPRCCPPASATPPCSRPCCRGPRPRRGTSRVSSHACNLLLLLLSIMPILPL